MFPDPGPRVLKAMVDSGGVMEHSASVSARVAVGTRGAAHPHIPIQCRLERLSRQVSFQGGLMSSRTTSDRVTRTPIQTAGLVLGIVFLLIGILGFIPGITTN